MPAPPQPRFMVRAIRGNVTIAPDPPPHMLTEAGLIRPDFAIQLLPKGDRNVVRHQRLEATTGYVMSVGSGTIDKKGKRHPLVVKVGDHVEYTPFAGNLVEVSGDVYLLMDESEIIGWLEEENAVDVEARKTA